MSTATRLEVMAEVGRLADTRREMWPKASRAVEKAIDIAEGHAMASREHRGDQRRESLIHAAAWALLALEAHDADAAAYSPGPEGA